MNFGRIYAFRPGYGYAGYVDEYADVNAPKDDGVFLIDMEQGTSRLLLSYEMLAPVSGFTPDDKVLGVHMLGNSSSEFICAACMAITNGLSVEQLRRTVFPHPTVSEILKEAVM